MRIYTKKFKEYFKIINKIFQKGNFNSESMYLDFKNKKFRFDRFIKISIPFDYDLEEQDSEFENIFVNIPMFLNICKINDVIYLNNDYEFYFENNEFQIPFKKQSKIDMMSLDKTFQELDINKYLKLSVDDKTNLHSAIDFVGEKLRSENLSAILFHKNYIISSDRKKVYIGFSKNQFKNKVAINIDLAKLLTMDLSFDIQIYNDIDDYNIFLLNGEIEIISPTECDITVFDPDSMSSKYNHETYIILDKESLREILNFFDPFVSSLPNQNMTMTFLDNKKIQFSCSNSNISGKRQISCIDVSNELISTSISFVNGFVLKAISKIDDKLIRVRVNSKMPAFSLTGTNSENTEVISKNQIVVVRLSE